MIKLFELYEKNLSEEECPSCGSTVSHGDDGNIACAWCSSASGRGMRRPDTRLDVLSNAARLYIGRIGRPAGQKNVITPSRTFSFGDKRTLFYDMLKEAFADVQFSCSGNRKRNVDGTHYMFMYGSVQDDLNDLNMMRKLANDPEGWLASKNASSEAKKWFHGPSRHRK